MGKRGIVAVLAMTGVVLSFGCVLRGPAGIKNQVERTGGRSYQREFGITVGRTGMAIARWAARIGEEDETAHLLRGVNKVQVGIYERIDDGPGTGRPVRASDFRGYNPIVQVRKEGETVMVLALEKNETIRKLLVVVDSGDELVIVRLRGNLEHIIEDSIRLGLEQGGRDELADPVVEEYRRHNAEPQPVFL